MQLFSAYDGRRQIKCMQLLHMKPQLKERKQGAAALFRSLAQSCPFFSRPYKRYWYSVASVVCNVKYCGQMVRPRAKVTIDSL